MPDIFDRTRRGQRYQQGGAGTVAAQAFGIPPGRPRQFAERGYGQGFAAIDHGGVQPGKRSIKFPLRRQPRFVRRTDLMEDLGLITAGIDLDQDAAIEIEEGDDALQSSLNLPVHFGGWHVDET